MCEEAKFQDILGPRRTQSGIFRFMSRAWYPQRTQVLDKIYSPQDLKDITANSLYLEAVIEAENTRSNANKEKLKKEIMKYIEEIGLDKKMHVIRWLGIFTLKIAFTMNIGIFVNEAAILKVKSTMGKNPLLFLPTHRSYADFCILTYLCFHYDIEFPAVASGMDFYSMAVIGQVLRETCAFYIRRTLAGAPLYAATLRQYVRTLVGKHSAPIEFFLEGTRSRSNKSLPPKYGMLSMCLMPLFAREVPDITVVPVNISYDRLMEQTTFAYEHLGVPKPKESTRGLLKWITSLNDHFGNMYINFGEPMSVREYLQHIPFSHEALKPIDLQNISPEQFKQVQDVAECTVALQQQNTVVTISNLIAIVLMQSLMKMQPLTYDEVLSEVDWLKKFLRDLGATVFEDDMRRNVDKILTIHAKSWTLDKDRKLRLMSNEVIDATDELKRKMKGHVLKTETMVNAIPIIQLQIYVNPILHYLVPPALVYLIVRRRNVTTDELHKSYERLRKILRHEFFHIEKGEQKRYNKALDYCIRNNVVAVTGDSVTVGTEFKLQYLLQWAVWPALTTLKMAIDVVSQNANIEHRQALKAIQEMGERGSRHPYSLSLDAAANCLSGLVLVTALRRDKQEENTFYSVVPGVMAPCRDLVNSVIPTFSTDFTKSNPVIVNTGQRSRL